MRHSSNDPPEWIDKLTIRNIAGTLAMKLHCYWLLRNVWDVIAGFTPEQQAMDKRLRVLLGSFVKKGDLVFDIGANRGNYTRLLVDMGAKVIAVEPNVKLYKKLVRRFIYDFDDVEVVWAAASDVEDKYRVLYSCEDHGLSSLSPEYIESVDKVIFPKYTWNKEQIVPTITLHQLMGKYGVPAFIKMDIEGHEKVALQAMNTASKFISVEYARNFPRGFIESVNRLDTIGMNQFNYTRFAEHELVLTEWVNKDQLIDSILSNHSEVLWGDIYAKRSAKKRINNDKTTHNDLHYRGDDCCIDNQND